MTGSNSELISFSRKIIMQACASENNLLDRCFYDMHILPVEKYVTQLCKHYSADLVLLTIAAHLHDISAIKDYKTLSQHHILGAQQALQLMKDKLENNQLRILEEIITNHSVPVNNKSVECLILSNADAMAKFDAPVYWVSHVYKHRFNEYGTSVKWYLDMLEKTYTIMVPEAKKIIDPLYQNIKENIFAGN